MVVEAPADRRRQGGATAPPGPYGMGRMSPGFCRAVANLSRGCGGGTTEPAPMPTREANGASGRVARGGLGRSRRRGSKANPWSGRPADDRQPLLATASCASPFPWPPSSFSALNREGRHDGACPCGRRRFARGWPHAIRGWPRGGLKGVGRREGRLVERRLWAETVYELLRTPSAPRTDDGTGIAGEAVQDHFAIGTGERLAAKDGEMGRETRRRHRPPL